jgi:hypothetical protein
VRVGLALLLFWGSLLSPLSAAAQADPALIIESIELTGVNVIRRPVMRARLGLKRGEPFDESRVQDARVDLLSTGLFQSVDARLTKGTARGQVRVRFDCVERATTSIEALHLGHARPTNLWAGFELADLDPFGLGFSLDGGFVASGDQGGIVLGGGPRELLGGTLQLQARLHWLVGNEPFVGPRGQRLAGEDVEQIRAPYGRRGGTLRVSTSLGEYARLHLSVGLDHLRFETPAQAEQRDPDGAYRAFEFNGADGLLSHGAVGLEYDSRNDPSLPSRGLRGSLHGKVGQVGGQRFLSVLTGFEQYVPLPFGHVLRLDLKAGLVLGDAPFFERWFIGDLHPYIPERSLGLNFARRRGPNLLPGAIDEQRYETVAGRMGLEYRVPLTVRGANESVGVELFVGAALISLGSPGEADGLATIEDDRQGLPLDLTIDAGLRIESTIGVMGLSVGNLFLLVDP